MCIIQKLLQGEMMRQCKIACNGTNSAAVDQHGRLWVWGSGRFGLLGKKEESERKSKQFVPICLEIPPSQTRDKEGKMTLEEKYKEKEPLSNKQSQRHVVKDISMGPCHMGIITIEEEYREETKSMSDAQELFVKIKNHFLHEKDAILEKIPQTVQKSAEWKRKREEINEEKLVVECGLIQEFASELKNWPSVPFEKFYDMLFKTCKINFSQNIGRITDDLSRDLSDGSGDKRINIKLLRDCILGKQQNHSKVWLWGLKDERVGASVASEKKKVNAKEGVVTDSLEAYDTYQEPVEFQLQASRSENDARGRNFEIGEPVKICCGHSYCLLLTKQHEVWSWGIGNSGSLGLGLGAAKKNGKAEQAISTPTEVQFPPEKPEHKVKSLQDSTKVRIKAIASGSSHCLALTTNGNVYSWGNGQGGRLGHGDSIGRDRPIQIMALAQHIVEQIACGESHSACITDRQQLYMWGVGLNGRLGMALDQNYIKPELVQDLSQTKIERVFLGMNTSIAIDKSYMCYVWGSGKYGKLGLNADDKNYSQPRKLFTMFKEQITEFASGPFHTLALTNSGKIFAFGNSKDGKLGIAQDQLAFVGAQSSDMLPGLSLNVLMPQQLEVHDGKDYVQFNLKAKKQQLSELYDKFSQFTDEFTLQQDNAEIPCVIQTVCSQSNSYFLLGNGQVWACGANDQWQCCQEAKSDSSENSKLQDLCEEFYYQWVDDELKKTISIEDLLQLKEMNVVKLPRQIRIQTQINRIKQEERIKHIACGAQHVIVTTTNGQCYVWGSNVYGQLGLFEERKAIATPTLVEYFLDRKMKMAAAGTNHSLFLSDLGQVFSAGFNEFGQLGIAVEELRQQDIQIEQIDNWVTSLKESAIKQVDGLEGIRYIAAGAFHSLAVSDMNSDEGKKLALFSWGWGAYGQLGHSKIRDSFNLRKPKQVKFRQSIDTKVAFVAAGTKHTLCLDTEGNLWYFGLKEAVGIQSYDLNQYEPIRLEPKPDIDGILSFRKGLSYVAASDFNNYVLTVAESKLFNFGLDLKESLKGKGHKERLRAKAADVKLDEKRKTHVTDFKVIENFQAKYVSCSQKHSILIKSSQDKEDGLPYAWGDNSHYRFGKQFSKPKVDELQGTEQDQKPMFDPIKVMEPIKVKPFDDVFKKQRKDLDIYRWQAELTKNKKPPQSLRLETQTDGKPLLQNKRRIRFDIQEDIQNVQNSVASEELVMKDTHLHKTFNQLCREFHRLLVYEQSKIQNDIARAQDALIARIINFPTPIDTLEKIENNIPKSIVRNRQIYEQIFTYLQTHPCYLINWITNTIFVEESNEIRQLITAIFGKREITNNKRIINTLMVVAGVVFKHEIRNKSTKDVTSTYRTDSMFKTLFNFIYEVQTQNLNFNHGVIQHLIRKLWPMMSGLLSKSETKVTQKMYKQNVKIDVIVQELLEHIDKNLKRSIDQFNRTQVTNESDTLSHEILSLVNYAQELLMSHAVGQEAAKESKSQKDSAGKLKPDQGTGTDPNERKRNFEMIVPYLLDLLFGNLLKKISQLDYKRINIEYWDRDFGLNAGRDSFPKPLFLMMQQNGTISQIVKGLETCFRGKQGVELDATKKGKLDSIAEAEDSRNVVFSQVPKITEIAYKIFQPQTWKPIRFDISLVRQMFFTSLETKDPNLTVEIGDIIHIQNQLIDLSDRILIKDHEDDPIRLLLLELGNTKIPKKMQPHILRQRINLKISARLLLQQKKFVKCRDCQAPVTKLMLPLKERFNPAFYGVDWRCKAEGCNRENKRGHYFCQNQNCQAFIPEEYMPQDLIFSRYTFQKQDANMRNFYDVLSALPIIEENSEILKIIDEELKNIDEQNSSKNFTESDFIKNQKLRKFKETVENYTREKEQEGLMEVQGKTEVKSQQDKKKLANMHIERIFLDDLADKIRTEMQEQKFHSARLVDYETMLTQLRQLKLTKSIQTTQTCIELQQVLRNSHTGLSSEFLRDIIKKQMKESSHQVREDDAETDQNKPQVKKLWSGRLNQRDKKKAAHEQDGDPLKNDLNPDQEPSTTDGSEKVAAYFDKVPRIMAEVAQERRKKASDEPRNDEANPQELAEVNDDKGASEKGSRSLVGAFSTVQLQKLGCIKEIPNSYDFDVLRESKFIFNDNGAGGFNVELSYREPSKVMFDGALLHQEVVLESFEISREQLSEMRRNFACQVVAIFGKTKFQFRVFELLKVLNKVVSQNNIFAEVSKEDDLIGAEQGKKNRADLKRLGNAVNDDGAGKTGEAS